MIPRAHRKVAWRSDRDPVTEAELILAADALVLEKKKVHARATYEKVGRRGSMSTHHRFCRQWNATHSLAKAANTSIPEAVQKVIADERERCLAAGRIEMQARLDESEESANQILEDLMALEAKSRLAEDRAVASEEQRQVMERRLEALQDVQQLAHRYGERVSKLEARLADYEDKCQRLREAELAVRQSQQAVAELQARADIRQSDFERERSQAAKLREELVELASKHGVLQGKLEAASASPTTPH